MMSMLRKTVLATAATFALAAPALAQDVGPWDLRDRMAYVVDPAGKMKIMQMSDKGMAAMARRAKRVPRGTAFFMYNGQLYMMNRGAFDRAGGFMGGGN
jgi:hypothetical protein